MRIGASFMGPPLSVLFQLLRSEARRASAYPPIVCAGSATDRGVLGCRPGGAWPSCTHASELARDWPRCAEAARARARRRRRGKRRDAADPDRRGLVRRGDRPLLVLLALALV